MHRARALLRRELRHAGDDASFFVSGFYYYEERGNGTPLQFNHTGTGGGAIGGRLGTLDNGELRFSAYGPPKALDQPGAVN